MTVPLSYYLGLSALIFTIGVAGVLCRKNMIVILMAVELMLNAANLAFIALARDMEQTDGQVIVLFVMTVAAAEAVVGLAIVLCVYRNKRTLDATETRTLCG